MSTLTVSIVTYFSDEKWFKATCAGLFAAIAHARAHAGVTQADVWLIDNSDDASDATELYAGVRCTAANLHVRTGHGNIGYGAGHNLSLLHTRSDVHLVLNPDCVLRRNALTHAINVLLTRKDVVCVTPRAVDVNGAFASLCKRRVTPYILALRALGRERLHAKQRALLDRYEYRGELGHEPKEVFTASGACMFLRGRAVRALGGFDERFFLHFEDVDLSLRLHARGKILYVPGVTVMHAGGGAARKHAKHILVNGCKYFWKWGLGDPLTRLSKNTR